MFVLNNEHPFFFVVKWRFVFQLPLLANAPKKIAVIVIGAITRSLRDFCR